VIQLITGHCYLRYHQHKWNGNVPEECRFCGYAKEDADHIIRDCPKFRLEREAITEQVGFAEVSSYHLEAFARGKIGELLTVEKVGENYDE